MAWFKLDDEGAFHAKVIRAGNEAYGAWCRAGQWASKYGTDGFIPRDVALSIGKESLWSKLEKCGGPGHSGLVDSSEGGWQIHDYLEWNPTAEEVLEKRRRTSEVRKAAANKRWNNIKDLQHANDANAMQSSCINDAKLIHKTCPVPVPVSEEKEIDKERDAQPSSPPVEPAKTKKGRGKGVKTSLPSDWATTQDHITLGASLGLSPDDVSYQAEKFKDRNLAVGGTYVNWDSAFSNWLRNSKDRGWAGSNPSQAGLPKFLQNRASSNATVPRTRFQTPLPANPQVKPDGAFLDFINSTDTAKLGD